MAHDVYLSYDERDLDTALEVCKTLESEGLKCWMKNRDVDGDNRVRSIIKAIKSTKILLLIHSENSKTSDFINNEVNEAFDAERSILVYFSDDAELEGNLKFFLESKPSVSYKDESKALVDKAKNLVKEQKKVDNSPINVIKKNKKIVAIALIAVVVIVAAVGFMMFNSEANSSAPVNVGDFEIKITDFNKEDVSKQDLGWNYSYSVVGTISPAPDKHSAIVIIVDFYDQTGKLVQTTETPFEDAQIVGSGFLFGSMGSDQNDVSYVDVQVINKEGVIVAHDDSQRQ